MKILKRNIKAIADFQLNLNLKLKEKLENDLESLAVRCTKINETRKFNQVVPTLSLGKTQRFAVGKEGNYKRVKRKATTT